MAPHPREESSTVSEQARAPRSATGLGLEPWAWWQRVLVTAMPLALTALAILNVDGLTDLWTGAAAGATLPLLARIQAKRRHHRST